MYQLRYLAQPLIFSGIGLAMMLHGGLAMWGGLLWLFGIGFVLEELLGDDVRQPEERLVWVLNGALYAVLPVLLMFTLWYAWLLSPDDFLRLGELARDALGLDLVSVKAGASTLEYVGAGISLGISYAVAGTVVAHELVHRTWNPLAVTWGRWILALTADASFAIEHVYGHHRNVATRVDPATARRGENAWAFLVRSTVQSYLSAWRIEAGRLRSRGYALWGWRNRMLRGNLMTLGYVALFAWAAGWRGAVAFIAVALFGKSFLEFVNYLEHYGIVRVPGTPVEPRHSWNSNRAVSTLFLFNLPRHSHHHAEDHRPYWTLHAYPDAPTLPMGYLGMILLAAVPPLWHRVMTPRVVEWDRRYATPEETPYIEAANRRSGLARLSGEMRSSA